MPAPGPERSEELHPLARELDERLAKAAPEVRAMLSPFGRRIYFPTGGILAQSAEARKKSKVANATIGIATEGGVPMFLPSLARQLVEIGPADAFDYAPPGGRPGLRERWREKLLAENPSLRGKITSLPVVTSAITHGLALAGDLFVAPGDVVVTPDKLWDNYALTYEVRLGARLVTHPFYAGRGFNVEGFSRVLEAEAAAREKVVVLLNFPNNPTGYVPSPAEGQAMVAALERVAARGTRLVVLVDDAYFGLFYHLGGESMTQSFFGLLANLHPNLLAVKLDGATKELFAWGLRCGFISFGPGRAETAEEVCDVLDAKVRGAIRSSISNVPMLSQTLVERALASSACAGERAAKRELLHARAARVHEVANAPRFRESWRVHPFNSGYFMCVEVKGVPAERVRAHLLERHGIGAISTSAADLRIAFSCLELDQIEPVFEALHRAIQELQ
jgi:aspartate/methionine/tyrosine aminotransferase